VKLKTSLSSSVAIIAFVLTIPTLAHAERCADGRFIDSSSQRGKPSSSSSTATPAEWQGTAAQSSSSSGSPPPTEPDDECIERNIYWMPGAFGTIFYPHAKGVGPFYGGGVQFAPYQWSHNNDHFGPSQGSTFIQAALLTSPDQRGTLALFEIGATASFERNSSRRFLIPYFGATAGGITQSELGTNAYAYPFAGIHLYWHHNFMLDADGGYHFPFSDIDRTRGPRAALSARFSLW
jgi:hypothetical protein